MEKKKKITTEILQDVVDKSNSDKVSINDLMTAMDTGGFGLVMLIFALPIMVPLPPPLPSFIAIPLMIFSFQMIIGLKFPRLPKVLSNFSIKRTILAMVVEKSNPYLRKAEKLLKRRLTFLSRGPFERVIGLFIFVFSASILLPLPFTNLIPGIGILIISLGLLGHDGLIIIFGLLVGICGLLITATTLIVGVHVLDIIKDFIINAIF